jgi:uncharacterized membrane protein YbhN (UPF0104 family)
MVNTTKLKSAKWWRVAIGLLLSAAAIYFITTNLKTLRTSISVLSQVQLDWLVLAICLTGLTFCIAAAIYLTLALKPLRYKQTVLIELAAAFTNRLLPAGIGGLGLHGLYLYKRKHTAAQATTVVSINNLLGIFAHLLLIVGLVLLYPETLRQLNGHYHITFHWWYGLIIATVALIGIGLPWLHTRLKDFALNLTRSFRLLRPLKLLRALTLALLLTVTYTFILYATSNALGVALNIIQIFVVFSLGMLAATATPTPGGLVGAEAGLFAGFIAYGIATPSATAAVILYRLVTYWLPLVPGAVALALARQRKLV